MKDNIDNKKLISSIIIGIAALLIATLGATFAYFGVKQINNKTLYNVKTDSKSIDSVTLADGNSLILSLTKDDMATPEDDITYWASVTGVPELTQNDVVVATASAVGNKPMNCDYTMTITKTAKDDLYTVFKEWNDSKKGNNQLVLSVNNGEPRDNIITYDFNDVNLNFPIIYNGTITNLVDDSPRNIKANFKLVNLHNANQSIFSKKDITFTFNFTNFECETETK